MKALLKNRRAAAVCILARLFAGFKRDEADCCLLQSDAPKY